MFLRAQCVTVAFCLIIALVLVNTWYLAWIYRIEKKRMAKAEATEGQEKYAGPNGGAEIEASPMSVWCSEKYAKTLMKTPVKVLVVAISLALFATSPIGISKLTPEYGPEVRRNGHRQRIVDSTAQCSGQKTAPLNIACSVMFGRIPRSVTCTRSYADRVCVCFVPQDFIKGCGVICDPSYLLHFTSTHEDEFDAPALPVTLMLSDFDINADREKYLALLADLRRGRPEALGDSGKACPGSSGCMAEGMAMYSWYDIFCEQNGCSASSTFDAGDIRDFLSAGNCGGMPCQFLGRDVNLPPDNATSVLPSMRVLFPMPGYDLTQQSMDALEAMVSRATIAGVWVAFFRECQR